MENKLTKDEFENTINTKYDEIYKNLTEKAFMNCNIDLSNKKLDENEKKCIENYTERYIYHSNNIIEIFKYKLIKN